jgi:hypothetical protein
MGRTWAGSRRSTSNLRLNFTRRRRSWLYKIGMLKTRISPKVQWYHHHIPADWHVSYNSFLRHHQLNGPPLPHPHLVNETNWKYIPFASSLKSPSPRGESGMKWTKMISPNSPLGQRFQWVQARGCRIIGLSHQIFQLIRSSSSSSHFKQFPLLLKGQSRLLCPIILITIAYLFSSFSALVTFLAVPLS